MDIPTLQERPIAVLDGQRMLVLGDHGGLSIVETGSPTELSVSGHWAAPYSPVGVISRGETAIGLLCPRGFDIRGSVSCRLRTFAVGSASTEQVADVELPGSIESWRVRGDRLFVVTREVSCDGCGPNPGVQLYAFDLSGALPRQLARLSSTDKKVHARVVRAQIVLGQDRAYIVEARYDGSDYSDVRLVDLASANGEFEEGATLRADGWIFTSAQLSEGGDVLRVVGATPRQEALALETYAIEGVNEAVNLGRLDLPRERLESIALGSERGYLLLDSWRSLDLEDPTNPVLGAPLPLARVLNGIVPYGNKLLAVDSATQETLDPIRVSLLDASDVSAPRLVSEERFGGDWGQFANPSIWGESALQLSGDGLLMVPFNSYRYPQQDGACGGFISGVQLFDFDGEQLAPRGMVPTRGDAERTFVVGDELLAVSADRVERFDISDRDQPDPTGWVSTSAYVQESHATRNYVARLERDTWTERVKLSLAAASSPEAPQALASFDLGELLGTDECALPGRPFLVGDERTVGVVLPSTSDDAGARVELIDVSNPAAPVPRASVTLPNGRTWDGPDSAIAFSGQATAQRDGVLVALSVREDEGSPTARISVIDASDLDAVEVTHVEIPRAFALTGLLVSQGAVYTSHFEPTDAGQVRFYLDRVDISNPRVPRYSAQNVPGSLVGLDDATRRFVVSAPEFHSEPSRECEHPYQSPTIANGVCHWTSNRFHLIEADPGVKVLSSVESGTHSYQLLGGDGFLVAHSGDAPSGLHLYSGFSSGKLQYTSTPQDSAGLAHAAGSVVALYAYPELRMFRIQESAAPVLIREDTIGDVSDVELTKDAAYVSGREDGLIVIPITPEN